MKKLLVFLLSLTFAAAAAPYALAEDTDGATYRFDFGAKPAGGGYITVNAKDKYSEKKGYGFADPSGVKNVAASGDGAQADAVEFTRFGTDSDNTFNVDLPEGIYKIKVTAGDIERMSVACEGYFAIMNMTGNECESEIILPVTDGQLNILATEGKVDTKFNISELEITKMPDEFDNKTRIFVGGDSTVTTYYPLNVPELTPTVQGGWGQMIQNYVTDDYYIINYATGGQFAKGFLTSGQFDAVEHYLRKGDIFIVAFGINDQNYSNEEEFKESMREMVRRVQAKGGVPVVVTAQGRLTDFDLNGGILYYKPDRWFKSATKDMCEEEHTTYVDLHDITSAYFTRVGKEDTTGLYWIKWDGNQDTLHINREGAGHCARLLVEEMVYQGILPSAAVPSYGYSASLGWKINKTESGGIAVQNLLPSDSELRVVRVSYDESGALSGVSRETITVSPYDVCDAAKTYAIEAGERELIYIYADGKLISTVGDAPWGYDMPSAVGHELYDDYIAPETEN